MFTALKKALWGDDDEPRVRLEAKPRPDPEPVHGQPRQMTGFFANLTADQKKRALAYRGPDWHGNGEAA